MSQRSGGAREVEDDSYSYRESWWQRVRRTLVRALRRDDAGGARR